jgi:hypothetical protein
MRLNRVCNGIMCYPGFFRFDLYFMVGKVSKFICRLYINIRYGSRYGTTMDVKFINSSEMVSLRSLFILQYKTNKIKTP